jgi:uncharacterized SAM-binding protein YcdF (DUF218 family)
VVSDLNAVAAFLALDDFGAEGPTSLRDHGIDCVLWAGNNLLHTAEQALRLVRDGLVPRILLSGGIGHASPFLWREVARHETYRVIQSEGRPEAQVIRDIAERFFDVGASRILVDGQSTNSGENAVFSRRLLEDAGIASGTILLVQDPTMQRRTDATFRHVWRDRPSARFLNWPTFTPLIRHDNGRLRFDVPSVAGLWTMDRFLSLVMGEIPRLRNDVAGYGPHGRGFIADVRIPQSIEAAYGRLAQRFGDQFGARMALAGSG